MQSFEQQSSGLSLMRGQQDLLQSCRTSPPSQSLRKMRRRTRKMLLRRINQQRPKSPKQVKIWTLTEKPAHPPNAALINRGAFRNAKRTPLFSGRVQPRRRPRGESKMSLRARKVIGDRNHNIMIVVFGVGLVFLCMS